MMRNAKLWYCAAALIAIAAPAPVAAQKVKVFHSVSTDHLEATLKDLGIKYKKNASTPEGSWDYMFVRNRFQVRIFYFNGLDLWIDAFFNKITAEDVNRWNRQARLSRAVVVTTGVAVESQLPCAGGFTEGMLRQFITGFDKELQSFANFLRSVTNEEDEIKKITVAHLEKLMNDSKLEFKKSGVDGKDLRFEFTMNQHKIQLTCHEGTLLTVRSVYGKMPLEKLNKYNVDRRYVRAFLDTGPDGKEFTALESYLDCKGGVTESILRSFLQRFDEELKHMDQYVTI